MAVYVDDMKASYKRGNRTLVMCHMIADTDEELHAMADTIGVSRRYWQSPEFTSGSHYDICQSKRALAVKSGAIEITQRQASALNYRRKITGSIGPLEDCIEWFKNHIRTMKLKRAA